MGSTTLAATKFANQPGSVPLWPQATNILLGITLAVLAFSIDPHPDQLVWSDLFSSGAIIIGSALSCRPQLRWTRWVVAGVGLWLMCAPLVFWAPTAAAYAANTVLGSLVVAMAVLVSVDKQQIGPEVPPGWSYNPSAWPQRAGIIACALLQFFIARHMAAYQLGHSAQIWDPVFGDGTRNVLESDVSKAFPISDAGLGAVTYLIEALTGFLGGTRRWRTMPWAVVLFGIMIVPVGVVSIVLVVLQPVAVGAWCLWCLITAGITVVMISPAIDELVATGEFLARVRQQGDSIWHAFWRGGTVRVRAQDQSTANDGSLLQQLAGGLELLSIPWNLAACVVVGLWLMVAPVVVGNDGASANNNHLVGALVVTFAAIGFGEASRAGRLVNVLFGVWMLTAPFLFNGGTGTSFWNDLAVGVAVIALSPRRGRVEERYGRWQRWIF